MNIATAPVAVVGGGIAGWLAALHLTERGVPVEVFEKRSAVGGRARSRQVDGFSLNRGAHALYRGGAFDRALRSFGVRALGRSGRHVGDMRVEVDGALRALPAGIWSLLSTNAIQGMEKLRWARAMARVARCDPAALAGVPVEQWIEDLIGCGRERALLRSFVDLATYDAGDDTSAQVAACQLQSALKGGVMYVDGGWQSLVDSLVKAAKRRRVRAHLGAEVIATQEHGRRVEIRLASGKKREVSGVVVAAPLAVARRLVQSGTVDSLQKLVPNPTQVATVTVGFHEAPSPPAGLVLSPERRAYFSVHSRAARLAPKAGALIEAVSYEGNLDSVHGLLSEVLGHGWRKRASHVQTLPRMMSSSHTPTASSGGLSARPGPTFPGLRRTVVAGDWVGPVGYLADASAASALDAASALAGMLGGLREAA